MQIVWSKMIEKFAPQFGIPKAQIEDTFNKPDKSEVFGGVYTSVKFYQGYAMLITFFYESEKVHFMNAYKVFPDMVKIDLDRANAIEILQDFMDGYGMEVDVPGVGKVKTHIDDQGRKMYQGILDVEKYMTAAGGRL